MQTSKSYASGVNNIEIKLELDDLEYVFADGRNLIIKHDENGDDADSENFVYSDGTQAVVLQSGVKHYIQTIEGETYLVDNDPENIQQLVINTEDQSEESNGAIEYLESDEHGEAVVYKLAETENEVYESQSHPKRFKIGDAEYITLDSSGNIPLSEDNQFSVLDEDSITENGNFQYAVLKGGKLHLQLCEAESIEVLNDGSEEKTDNNDQEELELIEDSEQYVIDKKKVDEYVIVNSNISAENTVNALDLSKISGKSFLTGRTINLDDYLKRIECKVNQAGENKNKIAKNNSKRNASKYSQYLNKKLLIRKNPNGKSLFGRILHIEPANNAPTEGEEREDEGAVNNSNNCELQDDDSNPTIIHDVTPESYDVHEQQEEEGGGGEDEEEEDHGTGPQSDEYQYVIDVDHSEQATEEQTNFLSKTLTGLCDLPSFRKKLLDRRLEVKYIEKGINEEGKDIIKDDRFLNGCLLHENGEFVLDDSHLHNKKHTTSLTVTVTEDINKQKTIQVTFHERPIMCHPCKRSFKSLSLLSKHIQNYHMEKVISCNVCQMRFENDVLLNEHRKSNGHYFNCDICYKRFTTQGSLKRHKTVHDQNLKLQCVICKMKFASVTTLSKHLLSCTYVKAYQCETCGKSFVTYGDLNVHKKVHNPSKMCYCDICGREFSRHSNLLRHNEIHKGDGDLYKCGICECSYKFISSLTRHVVQNHMKRSG